VTACGESILIGITESEGSTPSPENFVRDFGEGSCSRREREALVRGGRRVHEFRTLNKEYGFGCKRN